jgi:hypothetical protein
MKGDAFALAGLGGFNAHGAGFLAAASKHQWVPDLITATSGQVLLLAEWLRGKNLRTGVIDSQRETNPLAQLQTALWGYPGVFRPAYAEAIRRFWTPPLLTDSFTDAIADRLLPAQEYVPTRSTAFLEEVAQTFNEGARIGKRDIGILFNAYDLSSGQAVLYGNDRARELLPKTSSLPRAKPVQDVHYAGRGRAEAEILPITQEAVQAALWLSLYGFEGLPNGQMDGAYHRSCLVSELHGFDRVFVARPLANGWLGRKPANWFEVQDWQCEMWFSVGYKAEVDALKRINQLIDRGLLNDPNFKKVELYEIEPATPAGYFNYFVERDVVFDRAFVQADQLFTQLSARPNALSA